VVYNVYTEQPTAHTSPQVRQWGEEAVADSSAPKDQPGLRFGYVVIVEGPDNGYRGGYLCTDHHGVPIDFWHTTAVKPTRIQELLYGAALKPQLFGKHIAASLLGRADASPTLLLVDDEATFEGLQDEQQVLVRVQACTGGTIAEQDEHSAHVQVGPHDVLLSWRPRDHQTVEQLLPSLRAVDLLEPFERIRTALRELSSTEPPEAQQP